jgi:hypothetical protein
MKNFCLTLLLLMSSMTAALASVNVVSVNEAMTGKRVVEGRASLDPTEQLPAKIEKNRGQIKITLLEPGRYALMCGSEYQAYPVGTSFKAVSGMFTIPGHGPYRVGQTGQYAISVDVSKVTTVIGVCRQDARAIVTRLTD